MSLVMVHHQDPEQVHELELLRREYEVSFGHATEPAEKERLARMIHDLSACLATFEPTHTH